MGPAEVRNLTDTQLVDMLISLHPSDQAVAWLASVISNETAFEGVRELRHRFATSRSEGIPTTPTGRHISAMTVLLDPERFRGFFWRRRIPLNQVGPLIDRSDAWANVMIGRRKAGFYALDDLACALGIHVNDLIDEVGTDGERERLALGV